MNCQQTQEKLCELSAQACDEKTEQAMREHLAQCPPCEKEWQCFQDSMHVVSTATQALPASSQSRAMWAACEKKLNAAQPHRAAPISLSERISGLLGLQPRWTWLALGGAMAAFCGAWLVSPPQNAAETPREYSRVVARSVSAEEPLQFAGAKMPPRDAALFIDHHASMGFDPFTDHVGSTLVSFSASAPVQTR